MSEQPVKSVPSLLVERMPVPMICHFVNCHEVWPQEIRRHFSTVTDPIEIRFDVLDVDTDGHFVDSIGARAFVVLQVSYDTPIDRTLRTLHQLQQRQAYVAVVGSLPPSVVSAIYWAGAVAVVTDLGGCDRLAAMLAKAARTQPNVLVGWKHRFLSRIPWPSGSDSF